MSRQIAAAFAVLLAGCNAGAFTNEQTARGEALLAQRLAGKVAGAPVECLPTARTHDLEVVDRDTLLYHDGRTTWRQDTDGSCYPSGLQTGYALVIRNPRGGGQTCNGDIAHSVNTASGMFAGSCAFNAFVPYRAP